MSFPPVTDVLDLAVAIQQIPAPTFQEEKRAAFVRERFASEGLVDVHVDSTGNVYARVPGSSRSRPLVVSAHLDTVFPTHTDLAVKRLPDKITGPGIGDNSLGVASLFGLLWMLPHHLPGDLWLVANVGEEGLGNLRGMKAVIERFGNQPLAYIVLEGMAFGQIYFQALEVQRYRIIARTSGGHSWVDYGKPSAVHEIARLTAHLSALKLPETPRTTLNIGMISGGTSVNTIASHAEMELDLRSEDGHTLRGLIAEVEAMVREANRPDVHITAEVIGRRPAGKISLRHPLVQLAYQALETQGVRPYFNAGSTDANIPLSQNLPAICIGITNGYGAHTMNEYILTEPVGKGLAQLSQVVETAFDGLKT